MLIGSRKSISRKNCFRRANSSCRPNGLRVPSLPNRTRRWKRAISGPQVALRGGALWPPGCPSRWCSLAPRRPPGGPRGGALWPPGPQVAPHSGDLWPPGPQVTPHGGALCPLQTLIFLTVEGLGGLNCSGATARPPVTPRCPQMPPRGRREGSFSRMYPILSHSARGSSLCTGINAPYWQDMILPYVHIRCF